MRWPTVAVYTAQCTGSSGCSIQKAGSCRVKGPRIQCWSEAECLQAFWKAGGVSAHWKIEELESDFHRQWQQVVLTLKGTSEWRPTSSVFPLSVPSGLQARRTMPPMSTAGLFTQYSDLRANKFWKHLHRHADVCFPTQKLSESSSVEVKTNCCTLQTHNSFTFHYLCFFHPTVNFEKF